MFLREKPETVRFMIFVTDPRNECTRKIPKVTRDDTEAIPLSVHDARTHRIGTASWLGQASCLEADKATCIANSTTTEETVGR